MNNEDKSRSDDYAALIAGVQRGDPQALSEIFERYFSQLVAYAQRRMVHNPMGGDGEGAAASAMRSFIRCATLGRFCHLQSREDLVRMLLKIVVRKAIKYSKRDAVYRHVSNLTDSDSSNRLADEKLFPTPDVAQQALIVQETLELLLTRLRNDILRSIVLMQLEGYATPHIAQSLDISTRSVRYNLKQIRQTMKSITEPDDDD
ncbi:MAG: ECF-type sigma factor [Pirellulaceae bacterium]